MENFSQKLNSFPFSETLAMNQKAADLRAQGYDIINLSIGEPDFETPFHIREAAKEAINSGKYFGYPPIAGYKDLREAISEKVVLENKITCNPNQVIISGGAKQALFNIFTCFLNPGDEVIIFTPYWVSYDSIVRLTGGTPVYLREVESNDFDYNHNQLEKLITPKTKAILFSSPCNPTGHVFSQNLIEGIVHVLSKHKNIIAVADEIYEYLVFSGKHISLGSYKEIRNQVITVNGFSKGFAMTGWRVGYMIATEQIVQACEKIQSQVTASSCSISQRAALAAIKGNRDIVQTMCDSYKQRRDSILPLLKTIEGISLKVPNGAFYLFPDISHYFGKIDGDMKISNSADFCSYMLQNAHTTIVEGAAFGAPNHVRLSYATKVENLIEAIERIKTALKKLRN